MDILNLIRRSTPEQCREMGELILEMGTKPRTREWYGQIDTAIALQPVPKEQNIAEAIEKGRARVMELNDGLLADGMNHEKLMIDELKRRGDGRTLPEYIADVCNGSAISDVMHSRD